MNLALAFAGALFLSVTLLPVLMRNAARWGLMDDPAEERKIHTELKPRIGGIGIVAATFLSAGYWLAADALPAGLVAGAVVIVAFGYLDDRYTLRVRWKFLGQVLAVLLLLAGGVTIDHVPLLGLEVAPAWIRYPLSFFFVLGVINAVNMSDGLDGLAAGMVLMSIGTLAALAVMTGQDAAAVAALAVAGGVLGFLRYNTFPSRTFMGDTGSQFLGFAVAALAILVTQHPGAAVSPALPLLIAGLPVIDTLSVMALRIIRGKSPFLPDAKHLHHQFLQIGCRHHEAVAVLYLLQLALLALAWWSRYESDGFILALYLVFCATLLGAVLLMRLRDFRLRHSDEMPRAERRNVLLRRFGWVHRQAAQVLAAGVAVMLLAVALLVERPVPGLGQFPLSCAAACALLWLVFRERPIFVTRALVYMASALTVYALLRGGDRPAFNLVIDASLIALVAFLFLAIRMTRREVFRPDTQDGLVLLMIVMIPLLPAGEIAELELGRIALRSAALVYCCEYILSCAPRSRHLLLNAAAVGGMVVLGV